MKNVKRFLITALSLGLVFLTGCTRPTVEDVMSIIAPTSTPIPGAQITFAEATPAPPESLQLKCATIDGVFCPFWAEADGDQLVASLTQLSLKPDDGGHAPASISTSSNEDGSTDVTIRLESGLCFSDGTPVTARDLLFTYYVLLDTDYDGPSRIRTLPIRGLSEYWNGMDMDMYAKYVTLYAEIYNEGRYDADLKKALEDAEQAARKNGVQEQYLENDSQVKEARAALDAYDTERAEEIRAAIGEAWRQDAKNLVEYTMTHYSGSIAIRTPYTLEEVTRNYGLQVMYTMLDRGFGVLNENGSFTAGDTTWDLETEFPTVDDIYNMVYAIYNGDVEQYWKIEGIGRTDMLLATENVLIRRWAQEDEYWRGAIESIAGIIMTDDRTLVITMEYCDETVKNLLTDAYIVSLDHYGDSALFRTEYNSFGFNRGDLSEVRTHLGEAFGAGEYVYQETAIRTVILEPNPLYWQGVSEYPRVEINRL